MRNLGATDKQITKIFVLEGWLISLTGAVVGVVVGLLLCTLQEQFGLITMHGNTATLIVNAYPVAVQLTDVIVVLALTGVIGTFTSLVTTLIMRRILR